MTKEQLKDIWHEAWNKLADQHFEAFVLNCKSEINPNDFIGDCLAEIYNRGVQDSIDNMEIMGRKHNYFEGGETIDPLIPDEGGIYDVLIGWEDHEIYIGEDFGVSHIKNIWINKTKLENLKIK